ncbi:hypothetical protein L596_029905 [Steinernema carpocapsae]|uniref:Uncharacterized protein n=1 Tax=Steinernema carpocapsae TaxID=34508 RepID=A0A4V6XVK5_STECR|nr:hypothetical protein L596_029905 [Steinernema carpocapsae]
MVVRFLIVRKFRWTENEQPPNVLRPLRSVCFHTFPLLFKTFVDQRVQLRTFSLFSSILKIDVFTSPANP